MKRTVTACESLTEERFCIFLSKKGQFRESNFEKIEILAYITNSHGFQNGESAIFTSAFVLHDFSVTLFEKRSNSQAVFFSIHMPVTMCRLFIASFQP